MSKKSKKTMAKIVGLKNIFLYEDEKNNSKLGVISFREDEVLNKDGDKVKVPHTEKITSTDGSSTINNDFLMFEGVDVKTKNVDISVEEKTQQLLNSIKNAKSSRKAFEELIQKGTLSVSNPSIYKRDYLGLKSILEKEYFKGEYSNDTIRCQILYNFLDIKKIFSLYISKIIYSVGNVIEGAQDSYNISYNNTKVIPTDNSNKCTDDNFKDYRFLNTDFIGNTHTNRIYNVLKKRAKTYADFLEQKKSNPSLSQPDNKYCTPTDYYYNKFLCDEMLDDKKSLHSVFRKLNFFFTGCFEVRNFGKVKNNKKTSPDSLDDLEQKIAKNYDVFRLLALIRQVVNHNSELQLENQCKYEDLFFNGSKAIGPDLSSLLNEKLSKAFEDLYKGLDSNLGNNLYILKQFYADEDIDKLTSEYHDYIIFKDNKNLGVNTRTIREFLLKNHMPSLKTKEWDSCRKKIYTLLDFYIYKYLKSESEVLNQLISELRAIGDDEFEKDGVYIKFAKNLFDKKAPDFNRIKKILESEKESGFESKLEYDLSKYKITNSNSSQGTDYLLTFTKLMYFLSLFLEVKDINIFFDSLISKFDSIADLVDCVKYNKNFKPIEFAPKYSFKLNDFRRIANELRFLKNIGKMKNKTEDYEADLFKDAMLMLGVSEERIINNWVEYDNRIFEVEKGKKNIRNFIINNVIKSRWFYYLLKNYSPAKCSILMKNESLIRIVLNRMNKSNPEQINKYYQMVHNYSDDKTPNKVDYLTNLLLHFSFDDIIDKVEKLTDKEKKNQNEGSNAEVLKKVVTLYLTVLYLIVKGIVDANSRFVLAFSCYGRDLDLLEKPNKDYRCNYLELTERFIKSDKEILDKYYPLRNKIRDDKTKTIPQKQKEYKELSSKLLNDMHFNFKAYKYISEKVLPLNDPFNANLEINELSKARQLANIPSPTKSKPNKKFNIFTKFRNLIEHYNILANMEEFLKDESFKEQKFESFYSVFIYLIQQSLYKSCEIKPSENKPSESIIKDQECFKPYTDFKTNEKTRRDLQWLLNIPFAYNLPRYKNLSIEDLFNDKDNMQSSNKSSKSN